MRNEFAPECAHLAAVATIGGAIADRKRVLSRLSVGMVPDALAGAVLPAAWRPFG